MRIGIIIRSYGERVPSGMSRLVDLTNLMIKNNPEEEFVIYFKNKPKKLPNFEGHNWESEIIGFGRLWLYLGMFFAKRSDVYLFFTPLLPFFWKRKSIVMAHDFAYKYVVPKNLKEKIVNKVLHILNKSAFKNATIITAVSNYTKSEIIKFFKISENKIKVIYDGFTKVCAVPDEKINIKKPFFLFAGVIKERKNILNIIKAFGEFKKIDNEDYNLVISGKKTGRYYEKVFNLVKEMGLNDNVFFLGYIKEENLSYLYKNAEALVFPSLIEGFGMPVLEAMDCGLPVITSNRDALAETAGNSALLVNPDDAGGISRAMIKISRDKNFRQELIQKGFKRVSQFSWEKNAKELVDVANSLM